MKRFGRLLVAALLTVGMWCVPAPAWAQRVPLSELVPRLLLAEIVLESPPTLGVPGNPDGVTHLAHFNSRSDGAAGRPA